MLVSPEACYCISGKKNLPVPKAKGGWKGTDTVGSVFSHHEEVYQTSRDQLFSGDIIAIVLKIAALVNNTVEKVNMPEMNPQMPEINIRPIRTPLLKSFRHDSKIHIHS
jgi:hypothetical protein